MFKIIKYFSKVCSFAEIYEYPDLGRGRIDKNVMSEFSLSRFTYFLANKEVKEIMDLCKTQTETLQFHTNLDEECRKFHYVGGGGRSYWLGSTPIPPPLKILLFTSSLTNNQSN
jgi:hypothetical protein